MGRTPSRPPRSGETTPRSPDRDDTDGSDTSRSAPHAEDPDADDPDDPDPDDQVDSSDTAWTADEPGGPDQTGDGGDGEPPSQPPPGTTPPGKVPLYRNVISLFGTLVVGIGATLVLFGLLAQLTVTDNPYVGIFTYLLFPSIMGFGLVVFLYGMRWEAVRRKRRGGLPTLQYPAVDLNIPWQRRMFGWVMVAGAVLGTLSAWALYNGFLFTESVTFCGRTCHVPMEPEYTAYQQSAHARVPCVDCHVGEGASWYVRSKLSGARQVIAVMTGDYSRPIETPIKHLRPARETCEHCHWPQKFFGAKLLQLPRFRYDEKNTSEQITLTLKTGGGSKLHGQSSGIHWHMLLDNQITFATADARHLDIPWVQVEHHDGSVEVFRSRPIGEAELDQLERHQLDCMDCHNRPSHSYPTPDSGVDEALFSGEIAADLPWIKKVSVEALTGTYASKDAAHEQIPTAIRDYYAKYFPEVAQQRSADIEEAITRVLQIRDRSVFPKMHVDWRTYASHIGHKYWPGCFRCHDGKHRSDTGRVITHQCNGPCHTQPVRGPIGALGVVSSNTTDQWHAWTMTPDYVEVEAHSKLLCHECHRAGQRPFEDCGDCHSK